MKAGYFLVGLLCAASLVGCVHKEQVNMNPNLARAQEAFYLSVLFTAGC